MYQNQFIINKDTTFYAINIPTKLERGANRFYLVFDALPTKNELFKALRKRVKQIINYNNLEETYKERIMSVDNILNEVNANGLDDFLETHKTYKVALDEESYLTINKINPTFTILGEDDGA